MKEKRRSKGKDRRDIKMRGSKKFYSG